MKKFNKLLSLIMTVIMFSSLFVFPTVTFAEGVTEIFRDDFNDATVDYTTGYMYNGSYWNVSNNGDGSAKFEKLSTWNGMNSRAATAASRYIVEYDIKAVSDYEFDIGVLHSSLCSDKVWKNGAGKYYVVCEKTVEGEEINATAKFYKSDGTFINEVTGTFATADYPNGTPIVAMNASPASGKNGWADIDSIVAYTIGANMNISINSTGLTALSITAQAPINSGTAVFTVTDKEGNVIESSSVEVVSMPDYKYKVNFTQALDYDVEYTLGISNLYGFEGTQIETINNVKFKIPMDIELSLKDGALKEGTNVMVADIVNEKTPESAVLVGALYHSDGTAEIFSFDITTATATGEAALKKEISIEAVEDNAVFEMYIVDSLNSMNFKTEKKGYDKNGEVVCEENILPEEETVVSLTVSEPDPEQGTAKFTLTLNEGKADSTVYIKILDDENKIVYLNGSNTENSKAEFSVKFPQSTAAETYKIYWGYNVNPEGEECPYDFIHYSKTYIDGCAAVISDALPQNVSTKPYTSEQIAALTGLCTAYRYELDYTEAELQQIFRSLVGLRIEKDGFSNSKAILDGVKEAEMLVIDKENSVEQFITDFNKKYVFDKNAYTLFSQKYSDTMKDNVVKAIDAVQPYSIGEAKTLFLNSVAKKGIEYSSNYMQIREILEKIGDAIGLEEADIDTYKGFSDTKKEKVESGLVGYAEDNLSGKFSDLVETANINIPSQGNTNIGNSGGNSGGGGSGGGGGSKTSGALTGLPVIKTEETPIVQPDTQKKHFSDLDGYEWAEEAINTLAEKNIISGTGNDEYNPENNITRREIAKIIACAYELKAENDAARFSDVDSSDWAASYIAAVFSSGIMNGVENGIFAPQNYVTREMFATIIYRALEKKGIVLENTGIEFSDKAEISDYAIKAIGALTNAEVINGVGNNAFAPKQNLSRAEAAVMIYRALSIK